ncbi:rod shape-determining protein RodA ['Osedax' symbiont bacterium Rs2_46_30_T18]|nr:rod shape-determining protein RodA ['Osedax' symbiont bacterium Rs2_46_30_T18]
MSKDFSRSMQNSSSHLRRKPGIWSYTHLDAPLLILILMLCAFGLFVLYSASAQDSGYVMKQAVRMGVGLVAMLVVAQISPGLLERWAPWVYAGGVILLVCVLLFGVGAKGAQRWLALPGIRIQPSEIIKVVLPLTVAFCLAGRPLPPTLKQCCIALLLIALPTLLIMKQPDLGTSLVIASSGIFVLLFSGIRWRYIFLSLAAGAACLPVLWMTMKEYQKQRVMTFMDPESDPLGSGWNIIQSKTAIGSGGFSGKGWLEGTQSQLNFLPESHTDFIIAVLAEEQGLLGVMALITLYLLIIARGLWMAAQVSDSFGRLICGSIILTFFVFIFVNIGMVSGILPVVGLPLPMMSYGGTSIVTLMMGFGVIMSVHTHRNVVI